MTDPVKYSAAPLVGGREPFGEICMVCAKAGAAPRRASEAAAMMIGFIFVLSVILG
jgi:hypothetical protein